MEAMFLIFVGIGGFFGAIIRYLLSKSLNNNSSYFIPLGTLTVNLLGSFFLGILTGTKEKELFMLLLGTGFIGALTTFSTLKFEMTEMYLKKEKSKYVLYATITYLFGILLAYAGYLIGKLVN